MNDRPKEYFRKASLKYKKLNRLKYGRMIEIKKRLARKYNNNFTGDGVLINTKCENTITIIEQFINRRLARVCPICNGPGRLAKDMSNDKNGKPRMQMNRQVIDRAYQISIYKCNCGRCGHQWEFVL